jgi:lantibiotic modifying enzyme
MPDLDDLLLRGSPLHARLHPGGRRVGRGERDATVRAWLERWRQNLGEAEGPILEKRLAWAGLDLAAAQECLAAWHAGDGLPSWLLTLQECLEELGGAARACGRPGDDLPTSRWPFAAILNPFLTVARRRLLAAAGAAADRLAAAAHGDLLAGLRTQLLALAWRTVELEHDLHADGAPGDAERTETFVTHLLDGGLTRLMHRYPVLARLLATTLGCWVEAEAEFLRRLDGDWEMVCREVGASAEADRVRAVRPGLSDPHNRHRCVHVIELTNGRRLVYKPRDVRSEKAYFDFLGWMNAVGGLLPFRVLKVLPRDGYGWVEYVDSAPCAGPDQAARYFRRAGALLAILYALNGTDVHNENLIACGEQPVLIDTEMLLMPRPGSRGLEGNGRRAGSFLFFLEQERDDSVLGTGFLPHWQVGEDGRPVDCSGLGGPGPAEVAGEQQGARNLVWVGGRPAAPEEYVEEVVAGFREGYGFLQAQRAALLAQDGPLAALADAPVRFVYRPTECYSRLLAALCHPKYLQHGVARGLEIERLLAPLLRDEAVPADWPVAMEEIECLERMDVPYFTGGARDRALTLPGRTLGDFFDLSGYERVVERVRSLGPEDRERQTALIRGALYARIARPSGRSLPRGDAAAPVARLTTAEKLAEAAAIGACLRGHALRAPDGSLAWMGFEYLPQINQFQLQPTGFDLYDGAAGIGLFFAALERVTGQGFGEAAAGAFGPVRDLLAHPRLAAATFGEMGLGGVSGLFSIAYALLRAGGFLGDGGLAEDAVRLALLVTPERIAAESHLDFVSGCSGAAVALLRLEEACPSAALRDRLAALGERLLSHSFEVSADRTGTLPLTGMSHGAAGVAYALFELSRATGDHRYRDAGRRALAYERAVHVPAAGNWPDFRNWTPDEGPAEPPFGLSWCHGAPGIGLARLPLLAAGEGPAPRDEVEVALRTTAGFRCDDVDHLCCGTAGRIDVCLEAGRRLGRPDLLGVAEDWAAAIVGAARRGGGYRFFANLPRSAHSPGLFLGAAGVGYELLRLAEPEVVPSVLLLA